MRITSRVLVAAMLAATFGLSSAAAQAQNVRVRGTIEKLDGNSLMVKSRDGAELKLTLKDNVRIAGVVKASLADVKPESNVTMTSRPRPALLRPAHPPPMPARLVLQWNNRHGADLGLVKVLLIGLVRPPASP